MSGEPGAPKKQDLLRRTDPNRRQLMKIVLGATAFSVPLMSSFSLSGMSIDSANAQPSLPFGPNQATGASIDVEAIEPLRIHDEHSDMKWAYAAKFLCGVVTDLDVEVPLFVPGFYRTDLEILNTTRRRVALELAMGEAGGTTPTPLDGNRIFRRLRRNEGLQFDCEDILSSLGIDLRGSGFAKGWIVVRSESKVHVTAIHMLATESLK